MSREWSFGRGDCDVYQIVARGDVVELENYATQPVMLTEIRSQKSRH